MTHSFPSRCSSYLPVADGIGELRALADQFALGPVVRQRPTGHRTDQDFQQARIDLDLDGGGLGGGRRIAHGAVLLQGVAFVIAVLHRSEEHTSELQSLMSTTYAVFCLKTTK